MKIYCIHNARIPTEKAHGWQIMKTCEELAKAGHEVILVVPQRDNPIADEAFSYYSLIKNFKIDYLKSFDFLRFVKLFGKYSFYIQSILFLRKLKSFPIKEDGIVITRNPEIAGYFAAKEISVFYDAHNWPGSKIEMFKKMIANVKGVICNSQGTAEVFKTNTKLKTLVAPNGVDWEKFNINDDKNVWQEKFSLPLNSKIIMYVGHLYRWKGVDTVIESAFKLQDKDYLKFVLVGGTENDIAKYLKIIKDSNLANVLLLGHKQAKEIPGLLKSADILLLPNVPVSKESELYTSPIKMFEYMASGRPIIASDLPSIREVLNDGNSYIIPAGDANALSSAILDLLSDAEKTKKISRQAKIDSAQYTWQERTRNVLEFINQNK